MDKSFIIDGFPRTGTTTLLKLLNCHPEISCMMEPFHPLRYEGRYHRMAIVQGSVGSALALIHQKHNGIKHVWEATTGWPFRADPEFNESLVLNAGSVIFVQRRNLLRRYISAFVSRSISFWVGSREQFLSKLEQTALPSLNPSEVKAAIQVEAAALTLRSQLFARTGTKVFDLIYEQFFCDDISPVEQLRQINEVLAFLEATPIDDRKFTTECAQYLDPQVYRWADEEVYLHIPGIMRIEKEVGSDEFGWLFR